VSVIATAMSTAPDAAIPGDQGELRGGDREDRERSEFQRA
jgi:hypothetical protein